MKYGPPRPRSRGKLGYPAAVGVLALSAAGFVGAAAFPAAAAENLCGTVDLAATGSGKWNVQNNNYSQTGEQCVTVTEAGFTLDRAQGEIAAGGAPKSYPSLVAGCHWGRCTDTPGLPVKAADIGAARTGVDITPVKDGSWNAAYDLWFDKNPNAQGQNEGTELMIWVNGNDAPDPIGKVVATVDIAGATWKVWQGNIGWDVISFIREQPATSVDLPLKPFVDQAIERGATEPGDWMTSVQVGFEPWKGGEGLAMENFTLDLTGAPTAKDEQAPAQDQGEDQNQDAGKDTGKDQEQPAVDQDAQDQPAAGDDQDQAREQPDAPAPTRAPAAEGGEQPRQAPAPAETTKAPDASDEPASAPAPSASETAPQPEPAPDQPAPAAEQDEPQRDQGPQPPAPTATADQPAPKAPAATAAPVEADQDAQQSVGQDEQDGDRFVLVDGESGEQDSGDGARAYREVDVDGRNAAWSLGWGTHSVSGTARVSNLPRGEQVSIASLNDADGEALAIATAQVKGKTALVVKVNGTSKNLPVLEADYQVGQAIDFDLEIVDGAPRVSLDGDLAYQGQAGDITDSGENYWKTGPGAPATGEQGRGAQVELSDLSITHESASATAERKEQAKDTDQKPATRQTSTPQRTRPTTPAPAKVTTPAAKVEPSDYTDAALADEPVMLLTGDQGGQGLADVVDPDRKVTAYGSTSPATTPDGSAGVDLDGREDYLQVDGKDLSIAGTGQLTVEILMRPDKVKDLEVAAESSQGPMVNVLNKGSQFAKGGDQEWATRLYDQDSARPGRVSSYAFNPRGGQGAGSYDQSGLAAGQWVMATAVYDTTTKGADGWGTVTMYRDGLKVDTDTLGGDYQVKPKDSGSPLLVGGGQGDGRFDGAIGVVAIYPTALDAQQIAAHADAALTPEGEQDGGEGKSKGKDAGNSEEPATGAAGKESGKNNGQQQGKPTTGARPIPIPEEKATATS